MNTYLLRRVSSDTPFELVVHSNAKDLHLNKNGPHNKKIPLKEGDDLYYFIDSRYLHPTDIKHMLPLIANGMIIQL